MPWLLFHSEADSSTCFFCNFLLEGVGMYRSASLLLLPSLLRRFFFFFFFVRETLRAESFQGSHLLTLLINPWLSCKTRQCFARCRKIPCKTKALTIPDWLWVERNFRHNMWHSKFTCLIIQCVCVGERKRDNSFSVSF